MGVVSIEMRYRNDVSVNQPLGVGAMGGCSLGLTYYSEAWWIITGPTCQTGRGSDRPVLLPQGSLSGASSLTSQALRRPGETYHLGSAHISLADLVSCCL